MTTPKLSARTRAVRASIATDSQLGAVVPPIHLSSTFAFEGFNKPRAFDYTRSGNPTRSQLADALAALEEGVGAVVTSTGMSAVSLVLHLLKPGDVLIAAHDCYGGTQRLLKGLAGRGHFELRFVDLSCHPEPRTSHPEPPPCHSERSEESAVRGKLREGAAVDAIQRLRPRMVWIESPSNPLLRITDIRTVAASAHIVGAIVVVDNTFLSPALQQPIALGADIVVHSTTKYLNGHSDVVGGAVVAADAALAEELKWWANAAGITGAPFDSYLTLRGVRTLHSRIRDHLAGAEAVVAALSVHSAVGKLYYPGLRDHPGHDIARAQQFGFGAMVSFELRGGTRAVETFTQHLGCFTLAESLGGVESLVAHPATMTHASMDREARAAAGISDSLVRLSVGIESPEDLADDLVRALDAVAREEEAARGRPRAGNLPAPQARPGTSDAAHGQPATGVAPNARSSTGTTDVVLLGVGAIGRELLWQLNGQARDAIRIVGLVDSSGFVFDEHGLPSERLAALRAWKAEGHKLDAIPGGQRADGIQAIHTISRRALARPVLVDATAADTSAVLELAVSRGFDLVLANKVPLAAEQGTVDRLLALAAARGRTVLHEATVGAGLPVLDTLRKLQEAGDTVLSIEGCPSGTLGYLFGELGRGEPFSEAIHSAVAHGYTEPDPRVDLSGVDVARKALILARAIGFRGDLSQVQVESLVPPRLADCDREEFLRRIADVDREWAQRVNAVRKRGRVLRYRAIVTPDSIRVGLTEVRLTDPLGSLRGTDNQFAFTTTRYHARPLVITGPGAGSSVTAAGVFNDVLRMANTRRHPVDPVDFDSVRVQEIPPVSRVGEAATT